jgi:hypothetical protein
VSSARAFGTLDSNNRIEVPKVKATDGESDTTDLELKTGCKDQMRNTLELETTDNSATESGPESCAETTEGEEGDPTELFGQDDIYSSASDREVGDHKSASSGSDSDIIHGIPTLEKDGGPFPEWTLDPCGDSDDEDCDSRDEILAFLDAYQPELIEHPPKTPMKQSTIYDVFNSGFLEEGQARWAAEKLRESITKAKINRYKTAGNLDFDLDLLEQEQPVPNSGNMNIE